ncbi:hypothetical protein M9Y10_028610 [Tritrichomonas musculus]|uniref:DUF3447 domain-containing protein n=1 Tax=Tritrichomonas musculus TaxID=1915356 RepID=A0ABR2KKK5_9EUKA
MDIHDILSTDVINEANIVIELQYLLCKLSESNIEETFTYLNSTIFVKTKEKINQLAHNILTILDNTIGKIDILFQLVRHLFQVLPNNLADDFKFYFIHNFINHFASIKAKKHYVSSFARYTFIRLCCENKIIEIADIIKEIKYWVDYLPQQETTHFALLMYFADYINQDADLYEKMSKAILNSTRTSFTNDALSAYSNFKEMEKQNKNFDNLIFLTKNYYPSDSILYYIKNDLLDEFCTCIAQKSNFNILEYSPITFYEPHHILHNKISLIGFAAFYGSIKIFKHLLVEFNTNRYTIFQNEGRENKLTYLAICGGNFEIIKLILHEREKAGKSPKYATLYYQNNIYDWLQDNPTSEFSNILHASCRVNNIKIFLDVLKQGCDVTQLHKGLAPIHYAALNGHCDILRILLTLPYIDINCLTTDNVLYNKLFFYSSNSTTFSCFK